MSMYLVTMYIVQYISRSNNASTLKSQNPWTPKLHNHPGQTPRFGAAAISILLEPIRQYYVNIRQYYMNIRQYY